jgi:hypothetical protein
MSDFNTIFHPFHVMFTSSFFDLSINQNETKILFSPITTYRGPWLQALVTGVNMPLDIHSVLCS